MTFLCQIEEPPRSFRRCQPRILMLALVAAFGSMTAQSQTIMLNTGLVGTTGSTLISLNSPDDNWQVTTDPINTNVPRSAVVVSKVASSQIQWVSPLPNSYW